MTILRKISNPDLLKYIESMRGRKPVAVEPTGSRDGITMAKFIGILGQMSKDFVPTIGDIQKPRQQSS